MTQIFPQCKSTGRRRDRTDLYKGLHSDILASSSAVWHNYSNKKSLTTERHGQLLSTETNIKEYPGQKSLWPSKHWLCVPNQRSLSDRLHHIDSNIIRYSPSSRSGRSSASHLSLLTDSSISTVQRKRWKNVSADNLDYRETKILNYVLDNALRTAKNMQRTTERMVQKLASDLGNPTSCSSFTL
ncbi:hypothetical protein GDO81_022316 [Engystomops pustulosus]|uniref:Uncharacterized protein n=1 Tax=Engystomops pustulosus TaxID=76066 RepID=A0AAV6ZIF9_ENGPU|nr:hypothetical protein GDO81_022316 [Engystomops pustulosus]